jgi:hypothetical protein
VEPETDPVEQWGSAVPDPAAEGGATPGRHILEQLFGWWVTVECAHLFPHY